ncbi:hypothetical protein [Actinoallomurus liliacearum]|uniref:hypothetical protein n=1 Tax=Actinoallomurus liliacearum TaxID=1080073 RepID=UPI0031E51868
MAVSAGEIIGQIHAAIEHLDQARAALRDSAASTENAVAMITAALDGGSHPTTAQALDGLVRAWEATGEIINTLDVGESDLLEFLHRLGTHSNAAYRGPAGRPASLGSPASSPSPERTSRPQVDLSPEHIERLRAELPPPVDPGSGARTHGRWAGPDGIVHAEISGKHGPAWEAANRSSAACRAGPEPRRTSRSSSRPTCERTASVPRPWWSTTSRATTGH